MIFNASDVLLTANPGSLPNLSDAIMDWFQPMTFTVLTKTVVDHRVLETGTPVDTQGVRQPFSPQMLLMKPEGQRNWLWETFHCLPGIALKPDDVAVFNTVRYRVMQKLDWTEYGFLEFHLVQDYT